MFRGLFAAAFMMLLFGCQYHYGEKSMMFSFASGKDWEISSEEQDVVVRCTNADFVIAKVNYSVYDMTTPEGALSDRGEVVWQSSAEDFVNISEWCSVKQDGRTITLHFESNPNNETRVVTVRFTSLTSDVSSSGVVLGVSQQPFGLPVE